MKQIRFMLSAVALTLALWSVQPAMAQDRDRDRDVELVDDDRDRDRDRVGERNYDEDENEARGDDDDGDGGGWGLLGLLGLLGLTGLLKKDRHRHVDVVHPSGSHSSSTTRSSNYGTGSTGSGHGNIIPPGGTGGTGTH